MASIRNQFRQVLRRLGRAPVFTAATLVTLAVSVGANTAIFSVLEGVLLKPLPYPHPEELVAIRHSAPGINIKELPVAPSMYFVYREQNRTFQDIGVYNTDSVNVTGVAEPEQVPALVVTDGALPVLGIQPLLGRWFSRMDDSPGTPDTVLLMHGYWRRKFGGDPSIIGKSIKVDGKSREIIGVMPEKFRFLDENPSMLLPFKIDRAQTKLGDFSYGGIARLRRGVGLTQANADIGRLIPVVNRTFPAPPGISLKLLEDARIGPNVQPLKRIVVGDIGELLWVVMGSIAIVLLIACANVANLLLVRAEGRQQELAVRAALGATRARIGADLLLESVMLGVVGGLLGLALAYAGLRVLVAMAPAGLPRLSEIGIDGPVLLFTLLASLAASLLSGVIPVLKYAGTRLNAGLREGGRALSQSRERHRARAVLVVVQVALALVLLISSGLMIRTFRALAGVQPGFAAPATVQTLRLTIPDADVSDPERVVRMQEEMLRRIAAIPGVSTVGMGTSVPLDGSISRNPIFAQDRAYREGELPPLRFFRFVAPGYFKTLGTPMLAGRDFTWNDLYAKRPVVMVSENLAREYWRDPANALGERIRMGAADDWCEIVGVAANIYHDGLNKEAPATVTWPSMMRRFWDEEPMVRRSQAILIRSPRAGAESLMKEVRRAVWSVDPNLPLADVRTLESYYRQSMARTSFTLVILAVAGVMALLLGVVGLYGIIAYSVSQRTREIGIRMALGARPQELTGMFVRQGLLLAAAGVACGLGAAFVVVRLMSSLLFNVRPVDPLTYAATSLALVAATVLASYLPSRRVAAVDPVEAMRAE
jgi:predicted permease